MSALLPKADIARRRKMPPIRSPARGGELRYGKIDVDLECLGIGHIMRDLDALLNSLVNIDRDSLVAILSSEAEAAERLANSIRTRTSTQRLKRQQAVELAARINRILLFFRHDEPGPHMSDADLALCKSLERKLVIHE